jgi:hypothetical protein
MQLVSFDHLKIGFKLQPQSPPWSLDGRAALARLLR